MADGFNGFGKDFFAFFRELQANNNRAWFEANKPRFRENVQAPMSAFIAAMAPRLAGKVDFVNIGFDGPRATFSRVRGDYDKAMTGVRAFLAAGLPISLSAVVLRSTLHALPYLYQIADVLDAGKLKLILPLRKGNALGLPEREFITVEEARDAFGHLTELRAVHDWRPAVRLTPWTTATEGHMIVIEPNGNAQAWPVYEQPDLFLNLGNLLAEPITAIWDRYPYKVNHYAKYLGASICTAARATR